MAQTLPSLPLLLLLALSFALVPAAALAQEETIAVPKLFEALAVPAGGTICEVGAGDGALSIAAADRVGRRGHVYTNELGSERVQTLQAKVSAAERPQIHVMAGETERTNFPDGACDALFMRNVYHHFAVPAVMNASIAVSLKPSGRLAIIDFRPHGTDTEAATPADRAKDGSHGVSAESVRRELAQAGLRVERSEAGTGRWFMVVAVKPGT